MVEGVYDPKTIETQMQRRWEEESTFKCLEDPDREKYYCLPMFPYPSGQLHMGHVRNYALSDVDARFQRLRGRCVLHPIGWDAFGLPAENAALKGGKTPEEWTRSNIAAMRQQFKRLGLSFDWSREINTSEGSYYRWEQQWFVAAFKQGIAYQKSKSVNWCFEDQTVLANEQVVDGCCWRCGEKVGQKHLRQWFLRLSDRAQALLDGLKTLTEWPHEALQIQKNWIGRSEGLEVDFPVLQSVEGLPGALRVYTTRPETLYGVTYLAISPQHVMTEVAAKHSSDWAKALDTLRQAAPVQEAQRDQSVLGLKTPYSVRHPLTGEALPVWVANFVLDQVGTGAVMAVPAHDARDHRFAMAHGLQMHAVLLPEGASGAPDLPFEGTQGYLAHSQSFSGLSILEGRSAVAAYCIEKGLATSSVQYRLQDWGISRQRYWGTPIPILYDEQGVPRPEDVAHLPVRLPAVVGQFSIQKNPLKDNSEWGVVEREGTRWKRSDETFDTFLESSWYYLRYCSPDYQKGLVDPQKAKYWLPIDHYIGGIEHAALHLVYIRYFHKLLHEAGQVPGQEPIKRLTCQGMVLAETFYREQKPGRKEWVAPNQIARIDRGPDGTVQGAWDADGVRVHYAGLSKMSKSKNNGVDPMQAIEQYGADAVRLFILFTAPPQASLEWSDRGLRGAHRFLIRVFKAGQCLLSKEAQGQMAAAESYSEASQALQAGQARALAKVTEAYGPRFLVNVAIAALMEFSNELFPCIREGRVPYVQARESFGLFLQMLSPVAPHLSTWLWEALHPGQRLEASRWPTLADAQAHRQRRHLVVQLDGRKIGLLTLPEGADQAQAMEAAYADLGFGARLKTESILSVHYRPGRVLNFVRSRVSTP